MPNTTDMRWFKENFHTPIEATIAGTPFTLDLLVAIACQETGHIWSVLRKKPLMLDQILALCVGDTLDAPNRSAFPKTKAALLAQPRGAEMFRIARKALEDMAGDFSDDLRIIDHQAGLHGALGSKANRSLAPACGRGAPFSAGNAANLTARD